MISILQFFLPKIMMIKRVLPDTQTSMLDRLVNRQQMSKQQLSKIHQLGRNIGLDREEITAAIDRPQSGVQKGGLSNNRFFRGITIASILIIAIGVILIVWYFVGPESSPIHTYTPGTDYGSIKPRDFASTDSLYC